MQPRLKELRASGPRESCREPGVNRALGLSGHSGREPSCPMAGHGGAVGLGRLVLKSADH
eukprot:3510028-Alexandrium_andersonii.AAC.1